MRNHIYSMDFLLAAQNYVRARFNGDSSDVLSFIENMQLEGKQEITLYKYAKDMYFWKTVLGKHFRDCTHEDIRRAVLYLQNLPLSESTKQRRKISLKVFYRWLTGEDWPAITSWIKTHMKFNSYLPPAELIIPSEILSMLHQCRDARERTLLMLHWEAGDRIGETLNLRIRDVSFENNFSTLLLDGKTGPRPVPVYETTPFLKEYISTHPFRTSSDSFLFLNNWELPMSYASCCKIIRRLGREAAVTKPLNTHNFRHSRATFMAKNRMSEFQMCAYFGWVFGSPMPRRYVHMAGLDMKEFLLDLSNKNKNPNSVPVSC